MRSFLSENRIYSMNELVQVVRDIRGEDDVKIFTDFWKNNRFLTKYTQVIKRNTEYMKFLNNLKESLIKTYIKYLIS